MSDYAKFKKFLKTMNIEYSVDGPYENFTKTIHRKVYSIKWIISIYKGISFLDDRVDFFFDKDNKFLFHGIYSQ